MSTEVSAIVVDNGSGMVKAGFSGDDAPSAVFASIVGKPKNLSHMIGMDHQDMYIGDDAQSRRGVLILTYPIERGIVTNWTMMDAIWRHTYHNELRVAPEDKFVMLTEAPRNPIVNREQMFKYHFDDYNVAGAYIVIQAMLSLYASGRTTGLVYDSGDGVTHTVPIYEGYSLNHATKKIDLAGRNLTTRMGVLLTRVGTSLTTSAEKEIAKDIKEKLCYVAANGVEAEATLYASNPEEYNKSYELPDGRVINIAEERYMCPEALFDPSLLGMESEGVHKQVVDTIQDCDMDVRRELYRAIVCSGGTTMFSGIGARMTEEIKKVVAPSITIKVVLPPERKFSVWIGGSILCSLSSFQSQWVTRAEYEEQGPQIALTRCY